MTRSREIVEYAAQRKPRGEPSPTWSELVEDINSIWPYAVTSVAGLRSRVAEYRRLARYEPDRGVYLPETKWGDGLAPLVPHSTTETWERVASISDLHWPWTNMKLFEPALDVIADFHPHLIVFNGDWNDYFQISRFNKSLSRLDKLQDEIDGGVELRRRVRERFPNAIIRENMGNHCERLITYVHQNAKVLSTLRALQPESLLGWTDLEIIPHGRAGFRIRPEFVIEHGHLVRSDAGASAKARLNQTLISGIMAHTHRLVNYPRVGYKRIEWHEQGCMCLPYADYIVGETNWTPGFVLGTFHTGLGKEELFNVEHVKAVGDGFIAGGRIYGDIV